MTEQILLWNRVQGFDHSFAAEESREGSMVTAQRITPCLWFTDQAEAAATYYVGIFKN